MGRPKLIEHEALLAIAREVFRKHGHTATTRQVARAAGISQAALYKRFKDKDALFIAALTGQTPSLARFSAIKADGRTPQAYLAVFAARAKDHFRAVMPSILSHAAHPKYGKEMMGQIHRHNRAGEISALLVLRLETWRKAGLTRPMDPRVFTHAFIHALHSLAMVEVLSGGEMPGPTTPAEMKALVELFWRGIEAGKRKPAR
jgi:AcrR family transcriptional regulator